MRQGKLERKRASRVRARLLAPAPDLSWVTFIVRTMHQHYPTRRAASQAVVAPILVIGWNGMRPADYDELMLKWISAALALSLIAAFVWAHRDFRSIECTPWLDGECIRMEVVGVHRQRQEQPVLPMENAGQWRDAQP
jgi:hypothetical protein